MMAASVTTESSLRVGTPRQPLQGICYNLAPGATVGFLIICGLLALPSLSTPLDANRTAQEPETRKAQRMAAEQGEADAQHRLGLAYQNGDGVPRDDVEAVSWYRLAAVQGHRRAQNDLGNAYATGAGVPQDTTEAIRWFRLAAEQGYAVAQGNLGVALHQRSGRR